MRINIGTADLVVSGRLIRIARLDGEYYRYLDDPGVAIEALKRSQLRVDLLTFTQQLPDSSPRYSYPWEWDNLAVLPVTTFDAWWAGMGFKARNKAKQAPKKGVVIREVPFDDALIAGISSIYNETPVRQGRRFPHFGRDLDTVRKQAGTFADTSFFIGAYLDEELIGFAKLTADDTWTQAGLMHIISMVQHRDKAPTNAIIAQAVRSCAERRIAYLVYANFSFGNKERDSLTDFKERNGFRKFDILRYYAPLTTIGTVALRWRLHHNTALDYLPEAAIAKLRQYRRAWYDWKYREESS